MQIEAAEQLDVVWLTPADIDRHRDGLAEVGSVWSAPDEEDLWQPGIPQGHATDHYQDACLLPAPDRHCKICTLTHEL